MAMSNEDILSPGTARAGKTSRATFRGAETRGRLIGVVTDRDITIRHVAEGRSSDAPVSDVMSGGVMTCSPDDSVDTAMELMGREHGLERQDALALASAVVDLRVTQVVNGVKGVHARLAHDAIRFAT